VVDQEQKALRHVVVLCHPEQDSLNGAIARAYCATVREHGHEVLLRDLYAMGFHPVLRSAERPGGDTVSFKDVEDEQTLLRDTDVFVLVYPIWLGTPPAMLKGYLERVLGRGADPESIYRGTAKSVLTGRRLMSFTTSGLKEIWLGEMGQMRALKQCVDRYLERAFSMLPSRHYHYGQVTPDMDPVLARRYLEDVRTKARAFMAEIEREPRTSAETKQHVTGQPS
jgi:NAD(P)H dehydrogenase (quinone)